MSTVNAQGAPVPHTVRGVALPAPADPGTPDGRAPGAQEGRVSDLLHTQADRLLEAAAGLEQRADETRDAATRQDAQAEQLYWRAARLHTQADQSLDTR